MKPVVKLDFCLRQYFVLHQEQMAEGLNIAARSFALLADKMVPRSRGYFPHLHTSYVEGTMIFEKNLEYSLIATQEYYSRLRTAYGREAEESADMHK